MDILENPETPWVEKVEQVRSYSSKKSLIRRKAGRGCEGYGVKDLSHKHDLSGEVSAVALWQEASVNGE